MRVVKGNEDMATPEVMTVVASLHAMVERFKAVRREQEQEVHDFIREHDLWHFEADQLLEINQYCDSNVLGEHEEWLASNHDC